MSKTTQPQANSMDFASCSSTGIMQHLGMLLPDHHHHASADEEKSMKRPRKRSKTARTKIGEAGPGLGLVCTQAVEMRSRCMLHTLKVKNKYCFLFSESNAILFSFIFQRSKNPYNVFPIFLNAVIVMCAGPPSQKECTSGTTIKLVPVQA